MPQARVVLRLSGSGSDERLRSWIDALATLVDRDRTLQLVDRPDRLSPALEEYCTDAGVRVAEGSTDTAPADVVVHARAADLPTPRALVRLVGATAREQLAHETRVLPCGPAAAEAGDEPVSPSVCVAVPGTAALPARHAASPADARAAVSAAGDDVRRLASAAVFVERHPEAATTSAPAQGPTEPPYGHPAAIPGTALNSLLRQTGLTPPDLPRALVPRPFMTVITRSQGRRLLCLEEVLTCLAGQSSRDFEVVLACHRVDAAALAAIHGVVEAFPDWLRERISVLEVGRSGRSAPLNDALGVARGRYAVVLDDDDLVASTWIETFSALEVSHPGTVLRAVALAQEVRPATVADDDADLGPVPMETGPAHPVWPSRFSLIEHLWDNASPPMTFAVPRGVFVDLGERFDESLDTTEDWDFLVRAAAVTGVASTPAVTAVYRVWTEDEGSRHLHDETHWAIGRNAVLDGFDRRVALLAPGDARTVRDLRRELLEERAEKFRFARLNEQAAADLRAVNDAVVALRERIAQLEDRLARNRRHRRST